MAPLDKYLLTLQFKNKIFTLQRDAFQGFFEQIMLKSFSNFRIIPSGGGDGGNDGWIKEEGKYYQVYAPDKPVIKDAEAAKKLKDDFHNLKNNWNGIAEIKEYYFVYNDKYEGAQRPYKIISELEKQNPQIKFDVLLANDLEIIFFKLEESDMLGLGFTLDQRKTISNAYEILEYAKTELNKDNSKHVFTLLNSIKNQIFELDDDNLSLEYELLECKCLQKCENINEAEEKCLGISARFPEDPRAFVFLAEIYLKSGDIDKSSAYLENAKNTDNYYWQIELFELITKNFLQEKIDLENINENKFPQPKKQKAHFYEFYALLFSISKNFPKAKNFIEKAIKLNPDKLSFYITQLTITEIEIFSFANQTNLPQNSQILWNEIRELEKKFKDISSRSKLELNFKKIKILSFQEKFFDIEDIIISFIDHILCCYFDIQIESILATLLRMVFISDQDLHKITEYLKLSLKPPSEDIQKEIFIQFIFRNNYAGAKNFFGELDIQKYADLIKNLEENYYEEIIDLAKNDIDFAIAMANYPKDHPELRKKIIEILPNEEEIIKNKLLLLLDYDKKDFDEAFNILKTLDISNLNYFECKPILQVVQKKQAWDFEVIILEKLLKKEINERTIYELKIEQIFVYSKLGNHLKTIDLGEKLLAQNSKENILNQTEIEKLLSIVINSCLIRGNIDKSFVKKLKILIEKYRPIQPTFEFRVYVETNVYIHNQEPQKAIDSIVSAVENKKTLSSTDYADLFPFIVEIGNQKNLELTPLIEIKENSFVKFLDDDQWYYIGNGNELDTIKIPKDNPRYQLLIDKKSGQTIDFRGKYSSKRNEKIVELIFSKESLIIWRIKNFFTKLSKENLLDYVQAIEVPLNKDAIDPQYLTNFMKDNEKKYEEFFNLYVNKRNFPFAILATYEKGIANGLWRIQNENKGFINFSDGTIDEFDRQKRIAKNVIDNQISFYIDCTSAFIFLETQLLERIYSFIPNFKIPQSVINYLIQITEKLNYRPGQKGHLGFSKGKIILTSIDQETREIIKDNNLKTIKILESKPENIINISLATKSDCFSEQEILGELCDACILAKKEKIPVLTEDYQYLLFNQFDSKNNAPEYFSLLALVRVLYEEGKIDFNNYLDLFHYLASYRFRFLSFNVDDIKKAVFGDKKIFTLIPENIKKLNFSLTLSEEYGVQYSTALSIVINFLSEIIADDSILPEAVEKIFSNIMETFPTKENKRILGQKIINYCIHRLKAKKSVFVHTIENKSIKNKISKLQSLLIFYQ